MDIGYKYRIYPNKAQKEYFENVFGCTRFIFNYCLNKQIEEYHINKKKIHKYALQSQITQLKRQEEFKWLKNCYSQSLMAETEHLDAAYNNFFRINNRLPKFKSKHNSHKSFTIPQNTSVRNGKLFIPKCPGLVKIKLHRPIIGIIKFCTVTKTSTNKYYISINLKIDKEYPISFPIDENQAVGVDLGIKTFATLSNGFTIDNPKYLKKSLKKLNKLSKRHIKKKKGSKNKEKSRLKLTNLFEKITNQRMDFLHKTTKYLVNNYETLCLETLKAKDMVRNQLLTKELLDISIGKFNRLIDYKAKLYGNNILRCGQFEPSSKQCSCGIINQELTLNQRTWTCKVCNITHDRDLLAANNIKKFCFIKNTPGVGEI